MRYKELFIIVEGEGELGFVNSTLRDHLIQYGVIVNPRKTTTGWDHRNNRPAKGGITSWKSVEKEIKKSLDEADKRSNDDIWVTTLFDFYAFKYQAFGLDLPELRHGERDPYVKVKHVETHIADLLNHPKFIPYLQLHEFETFILTNPDSLGTYFLEDDRAIRLLEKEIAGLEPELINDRPTHAPSKRIIKHIPAYEKSKGTSSAQIVASIPLDHLRSRMPHFDEWISRLETLAQG